jgi:hypothetical protein
MSLMPTNLAKACKYGLLLVIQTVLYEDYDPYV